MAFGERDRGLIAFFGSMVALATIAILYVGKSWWLVPLIILLLIALCCFLMAVGAVHYFVFVLTRVIEIFKRNK